MSERMHSEIKILEHLASTGYKANLIYSDEKLYVNDMTGTGFGKNACVIEHEYRFEGASNPSDMSVVYGIRLENGVRGTVVVGYGPNADIEKAEFFKGVKDISTDNRINSKQ